MITPSILSDKRDPFRTQVALKPYFQSLIKHIGVCSNIEQFYPEYYDNYCKMLQRHPEYDLRIVGFERIAITRNKVMNHLETIVVFPNGRIDCISIMNSCLRKKCLDKFKPSMRHAVCEQTMLFHLQHPNDKCEICNCDPHTNIMEVDHHTPQFAQLVYDFLRQTPLETPTTFGTLDGNLKCFLDSDKPFADAFAEYHKINCHLRMLCKTCNGKQPNWVKPKT